MDGCFVGSYSSSLAGDSSRADSWNFGILLNLTRNYDYDNGMGEKGVRGLVIRCVVEEIGSRRGKKHNLFKSRYNFPSQGG